MLLPSQKLSYKEKTERPFGGFKLDNILSEQDKKEQFRTWGEMCTDYYVYLCNVNVTERAELKRLYQIKDDEFVGADYEMYLNPYNADNDDYKRWPAKIRNYPIVTPILEMYLGEMLERVGHPIVTTASKDVDNQLQRTLVGNLNAILKQQFINEVNAMGVETGIESKEVPEPQTFVNEYLSNYTDVRAIMGQKVIDYLYQDLELTEHLQACFEHWIVAGRFYTKRTTNYSNIVYKALHPLDCYHPLNLDTPFVEDYSWFVHHSRMTKSECLDDYRDELSEKDIEEIEKATNSDASSGFRPLRVLTQSLDSPTNQNSDRFSPNFEYIDVYCTNWRSFEQVGTLTYLDKETGELSTTVVDDTYVLDKDNGDIEIKWEFQTQTWEGTQLLLSNGRKIYVRVRPTLCQRADLNNSSQSTLEFGGRVDLTSTGKVKSIFKRGEPFQILYNALHFKFEKTIQKNKDKIIVFPMGLLPDQEGWDMDKTLYYSDALGYMFFDESKEGAAAALQSIKVLEAGLGDYIKTMWDILKAVKEEWWDTIGNNRQRFGEMQASDGKSVTEQALIRSGVTTRELFRKFEKAKERDLNALLDISKVAFIDGKKAEFLGTDGQKEILNVIPDIFCNTDYNIFCKDGGEEYSKLREAKQLLLARNQTTMQDSTALEIVDSNNLSIIKEYVKKAEKAQQELMQAQEKEKLAVQQQIEGQKAQVEQGKTELEKYKVDKVSQTDIDVALIQANSQAATTTESPDKQDDYMSKVQEIADKRNSEAMKNNLAERKFAFDNKKHNDNVQLAKDKIKSAEAISKRNKN